MSYRAGPIPIGQMRPVEAQELARIGIAPSTHLRPIGHRLEMAGQTFIVTGHATREQFLAAARVAAPETYWEDLPEGLRYLRLSTD